MEVYPKIKATFITAGGWQLYNRYMSEHSAGQAVADVFTNVEDTLADARQGRSSRAFRPEAAKNFSAGIQVGNSVRTKLGYAALVSNTEQMKGRPVPDDWTSFATPPKAWEDRIAYVDPRGSSVAFMVLAALVQNFGEEKTRQDLSGPQEHARRGVDEYAGQRGEARVSGERPLMMYILTNHVGDALRKGAPLDFRIPTSGAVPFYFSAGVLKNARHPNAAKLYLEFLLSEGQDVIISRGEYSLRNGAPSPQGLPPLDQDQVPALRPDEGAGGPEEADRVVAGRHRNPMMRSEGSAGSVPAMRYIRRYGLFGLAAAAMVVVVVVPLLDRAGPGLHHL